MFDVIRTESAVVGSRTKKRADVDLFKVGGHGAKMIVSSCVGKLREQTLSRPALTSRYVGGGGGFFLACEDFGRMFDHPFAACTHFFKKWRLARAP